MSFCIWHGRCALNTVIQIKFGRNWAKLKSEFIRFLKYLNMIGKVSCKLTIFLFNAFQYSEKYHEIYENTFTEPYSVALLCS
jgi:hypothetical protein